MAVTGDDRIGSGRQSALENPVISLVLVYEIHRLRRMNEDCEVIDRSLRLPNARRRPPELSGQDARDLIEDRRREQFKAEMLVSATIRGTLPAAAILLDRAPHASRGQPDFPSLARAIAFEPAPAFLLAVPAERLAKNLSLRATLLLGQALGLTDEVRRKGQRADSRGRHRVFLD